MEKITKREKVKRKLADKVTKTKAAENGGKIFQPRGLVLNSDRSNANTISRSLR